jgi:hypothetical protein
MFGKLPAPFLALSVRFGAAHGTGILTQEDQALALDGYGACADSGRRAAAAAGRVRGDGTRTWGHEPTPWNRHPLG